jgi:hypothetical protein
MQERTSQRGAELRSRIDFDVSEGEQIEAGTLPTPLL